VTVAALVALDRRDTWDVRLPGCSNRVFRGTSLAELLDDAALHLMEKVPHWSPEQLDGLLLSPEITVRRVKVEAPLRFGTERKPVDVAVRLTVVCTRWAKEGFWRLQIPRLGPETFAVTGLSELRARVTTYLEDWARKGSHAALTRAGSLQGPHLELIDVEVELPSVLPSRTPKRTRRDRKPSTDEQEPEKRVWRPATTLRAVGNNLLQRGRDGRLQPALGRDRLVDDLVAQLDADGTALLLVGDSGVGKTAIVEAVAQRFADRGGTLQRRTDLWRVDGARLIAGMSHVGQWEQRLAEIVDELYHRQDILVVDDLPGLAWTGRSAQSDTTMADYLVPHLQRGEIRILAECTPERLEAGRLENPGFFANFRIVQVEPMDDLATYRVLLEHTRRTEAVRPLVASPTLLEATGRVARRFGPRLQEPGRSVRVLRGFLGDVATDPDRRDAFGRTPIGPADLFAWFSVATGLPRFVLEPRHARPEDEVHRWFAQRIVGQPAAVRTAVDTVLCLQQGLDDPDRPVATLLFVGPTGVGKTETAKALAAYLFGDARRLLRFDMSEVAGPGALQRLVGGAGRPDGDLTRAVANQPFSVVLLDEIEKAGPAVFDLLLQVLGEGRLTNASGHTTDFRNTVIVMTSNLGVGAARRRTGFDRASGTSDAAHYRSAARAFFRPEFTNRIDAVVPFRALGRADVEPLVQRIVGRVLSRRGLRRAGVVVALDDSLADWLGEVGFDPLYGARSLQRVVERELTVPLARLLVQRPEQLTEGAYIALWRSDGGLGMHLDPLSVDTRTPPHAAPEDWDAMADLHGRLLALHGRVAEHPHWETIVAARTGLLGRLDAGLSDADWDRLQTTTAVLDAYTTLASDLEDFATDWLARYRFEDGYAKVVRRTPWGGDTKRLVTQEVAVPVDRARNRKNAVDLLVGLEERVASMLFRVENWGPPEPFVWRFEPLHPDARHLARILAEGFRDAWAGWGRLDTWVRTGGPGETAWQPGDLVDGPCAVVGSVPGLASLVAGDAGLYLDSEDVGVDRLLRLVVVSVHAGEPGILTSLDAERDRIREVRIRGEQVDDALPPIQHRFGVLADDDPAVTLADLATGLRTTALRRVVR
jgi:ATP-dependent Clp protease ATP-binding subunit ClpC